MKIVFDRDEIIEAVSPMLGVVSSKNTIAALEGILIDANEDGSCVLSGYDSEKGIRTTVTAQVDEAGSFIINAKKLASILRTMPEGGISLEINDRNLTKITRGYSSFELHALPGSDFPMLPDLDGVNGFSVQQKELRTMLSQIAFAVATKDVRRELNGAFFKIGGSKITVVGCDSNQFALREKTCEIKYIEGSEPLPDEITFILPTRSMQELMKMTKDTEDEVTVMMGRKHVIFRIGEMRFFSRVIDGDYIDYERLIPKNCPITVTAEREPILRSLERASLVTEDISLGQSRSPLRCHFGDQTLSLNSVSISGRFSEDMQVAMTEDGELDIAFNCRYFIDAIRSIDREKVTLKLTSSLVSMIIESDPSSPDHDPEDRYLYLVVPVRVRN